MSANDPKRTFARHCQYGPGPTIRPNNRAAVAESDCLWQSCTERKRCHISLAVSHQRRRHALIPLHCLRLNQYQRQLPRLSPHRLGSVEEQPACFVVCDHNGQALDYAGQTILPAQPGGLLLLQHSEPKNCLGARRAVERPQSKLSFRSSEGSLCARLYWQPHQFSGRIRLASVCSEHPQCCARSLLQRNEWISSPLNQRIN